MTRISAVLALAALLSCLEPATFAQSRWGWRYREAIQTFTPSVSIGVWDYLREDQASLQGARLATARLTTDFIDPSALLLLIVEYGAAGDLFRFIEIRFTGSDDVGLSFTRRVLIVPGQLDQEWSLMKSGDGSIDAKASALFAIGGARNLLSAPEPITMPTVGGRLVVRFRGIECRIRVNNIKGRLRIEMDQP